MFKVITTTTSNTYPALPFTSFEKIYAAVWHVSLTQNPWIWQDWLNVRNEIDSMRVEFKEKTKTLWHNLKRFDHSINLDSKSDWVAVQLQRQILQYEIILFIVKEKEEEEEMKKTSFFDSKTITIKVDCIVKCHCLRRSQYLSQKHR